MGATITEISKKTYINTKEMDYYDKYRSSYPIQFTSFKKTRGTCADGGVLMSNRCYHIVLDKECLAEFKHYIKEHSLPADLESVIQHLFPNNRLFMEYKYGVLHNNKLCTEFCSGWIDMDERNQYHEYSYKADTLEFDVYDRNDFVLLPYTKKEKEAIQKEEERKKTEHLNDTMLKNVIMTALKEVGIELTEHQSNYKYKQRKYLAIDDKKSWNKLILMCVNKYLNEIAKDYGFAIKPIKLPGNHRIDCYTPLFFMDEVEMLNNNEQDKGE